MERTCARFWHQGSGRRRRLYVFKLPRQVLAVHSEQFQGSNRSRSDSKSNGFRGVLQHQQRAEGPSSRQVGSVRQHQ
eukprot:6021339-Pyramimonas_sp.AAC.1